MAALMTPGDYLNLPAAAADIRIAYGSHANQFGDLYLPSVPSAASNPVIVLLHGGCWRDQFGLAPLGQIARYFADRGVAVWNVEFRRLGGGGGWPETFLDVARGADFLNEMATEHNLDPSNVLAVGHSAGGHLALWLSARWKLPPTSDLYMADPLRPRAAVALAGIGNLKVALEEDICRGAPSELIGGPPSEFAARYAEGSPHALLPFGVAQVHVVGEEDALVPADYVRRCVSHARELGDRVDLLTLPDAGHFEVVSATSNVWARVASTILAELSASS